MPQVRAPLLARAGDAADDVRRLQALVPRPDDGRGVGDLGRSLPRAVRAARAGRHVRRSGGRRRRSRRRSRRDTAAVIVEPMQGEGGVRPLSQAAADAIAAACRRTGALLIADEVQCGLGRTGRAVLLRRARAAAGPDGARQGARRRRADWRGAVHRPRRGGGEARAITAAPTAATCWPAARRWCSSRS